MDIDHVRKIIGAEVPPYFFQGSRIVLKSHGIEDLMGFRNVPTLINMAWQNSFLRVGAINHLDMQVLATITSPCEMGASKNNV